MPLSPSDWHQRFEQQAHWTRDLRSYLYQRAGLSRARRILDVGCGTGVLEAELQRSTPGSIHALDLDRIRLSLASSNTPGVLYLQGDTHSLPYASGAFDIVMCHFLLLWVREPILVIREMKRVTRRGGFVLILAEPDYGSRVDYPAQLAILGKMQQEALAQQGADPLIGRRLGAVFHSAGLTLVESGILGGRWAGSPAKQDWISEWKVLKDDLKGFLPEEELERLQAADLAAWQSGERVLFVPTFYALGEV